jgi:hypothetical protein
VCVGSFLGEIGDFKNLFWGLGLLGFFSLLLDCFLGGVDVVII